ncbi:hypothetical protein EVAR_13743_1 [Eumeta japonica]|uniref:Uncharacterized protein n=1 Tax=Eumeta variegata TaxID=151549 RepID=A0A4C1UCX5_EUMVA|nr:hypothetical protein EVAR_13743_1 [Eumeta japonica]
MRPLSGPPQIILNLRAFQDFVPHRHRGASTDACDRALSVYGFLIGCSNQSEYRDNDPHHNRKQGSSTSTGTKPQYPPITKNVRYNTFFLSETPKKWIREGAGGGGAAGRGARAPTVQCAAVTFDK